MEASQGSQESQIGVGSSKEGSKPTGQNQVEPLKVAESYGVSGQTQSQVAEPPKAQATSRTAQGSESTAQPVSGAAKPDSASASDSKPATSTEIQSAPEIRTLHDYLGLSEIQLGILKDQGFDLKTNSWEILSDKEKAKRVLTAISSLNLDEEQRKKVEEIQRMVDGANPSLEYIAQKKAELQSIIKNPNSSPEQIRNATEQLNVLEEMEKQMRQLKSQKENFWATFSEQAPRYIKLFGIGGLILLLIGLMKGFEEFKGPSQGR